MLLVDRSFFILLILSQISGIVISSQLLLCLVFSYDMKNICADE